MSSTCSRPVAASSGAGSPSSSRSCASSTRRDRRAARRRAGPACARRARRRAPPGVRCRSLAPGDGRGRRRGGRVLGARNRGDPGSRVHERLRPALRRGRVERPVPGDARARRAAGARVLAALPGADPARSRDCRGHGGVPARHGRGGLRARPAHLPLRLGADDAAARRRDPRGPRRRRAVAGDRVHIRRDHAPGRGRDVGGRAAARACRRGRRSARARHGVGAADRDRADRARRDGNEGGGDAPARVAAARTPDRACTRLGADERRHDQGRDLRARAGAGRLGRNAPVVVRRARAWRGGLLGRWAA